VRVLDGETEARLSALGVLAGFPGAEGVMGDLGGGSLELVELGGSGAGRATTLPLGPFQLMATSGGNTGAMRKEADRRLESAGWLESGKGEDGPGTFYPVGGAWRTLARIHIAQSNYPLHVVHGYTISRRDVDALVQVISRLGQRSLARIQGVTRRRLETLPAAAVVLSRVLRRLGCKQVTFSAFGLREGHVYDTLSAARQVEDPLLAAAADIATREARFAPMGDALFAWTAPLLAESPKPLRRLQHASCLLSDIAWREHPDYRASQALQRVLYFPFSGVTHADRIFLAYAAFIRYGGGPRAKEVLPFLRLLPEEMAEAARVLGLAQRLAYRVSGATRALLERCRLTYGKDELRLFLPGDGSAPGGEAVERRLANLADALGAPYRMVEADEATHAGTGT
jgi:exopolyphosphatase/guanosine-5'-triphosphate,3'-diphosphate pyrophosphatase